MAIATTDKSPNPVSFMKLSTLVSKIRDMTINLLSIVKTLTKYIFQDVILTLYLDDSNTKIDIANNIKYSAISPRILMAKFNFVNLIFGLKCVGQTMASKIVSNIQIKKDVLDRCGMGSTWLRDKNNIAITIIQTKRRRTLKIEVWYIREVCS